MRFKSRMALSMEDSHTVDKTKNKTRLSDQSVLAEKLVNQYYACLYRLSGSILNDPDEADDAVQDILLRALANWPEGANINERRGWLIVLAVNHCRDRLRRKKARQAMFGLVKTLHLARTNQSSVEELADKNQHHSALWKSVQALDEKHRLPVILRFVHGMQASEIAQALQISEGTVYSRLHYAIQQLRERLGPAFDEGGLE